MKILNSTTRENENATIDFQTTRISEMGQTSEFPDDSYLHVIIPDQNSSGNYGSRKISAKTLKNKIFWAVNNHFRAEYWGMHSHENSPYNDILNYLGTRSPNPVYENSTFLEHINYDFETLSRFTKYKFDDIINSINALKTSITKLDNGFASNMVVTTTNGRGAKVNKSLNHNVNDNDDNCQMTIKVGNKISNEWIVPASGMLVVVGWLDSSEALNNKGIPSSYCVLEGKINTTEGIDGDWEILSASTVIPSKNITYVSFTIPVKENLKIRARTGFVVGAKSGQFSKEQDAFDTLSNSTANGFKCQVFSHT